MSWEGSGNDSPITWLSFASLNTHHAQQFLTAKLFQLLRNADYCRKLNLFVAIFFRFFPNFLITRHKGKRSHATFTSHVKVFLASRIVWNERKINESFRDVRKAFKLLSNDVHLAQLPRLRLRSFPTVFSWCLANCSCMFTRVCESVCVYEGNFP